MFLRPFFLTCNSKYVLTVFSSVLICLLLHLPRNNKTQYYIFILIAIAYFLLGFRFGVENATIGQACFQCGLLYIFFRGDKKKHLYIGVLIVTLGLLSGKSKFFWRVCNVYRSYILFLGTSLDWTIY